METPMLYEFVKKTDEIIETEKMMFEKFIHAMAMVAKSPDQEFKIMIDKTIEISQATSR
jgi:hypothetical protein